MPDLTCSTNARTAFDFFIRKGLRDFQAAGIIGNLMQESGASIDPTASGDFDNGVATAHGIAQWRFERWQNLLNYASLTGRSPQSFGLQLEFLWNELVIDRDMGSAIGNAKTLEEATVAFQDKFEKCGDCQTEARIAFAKSVLVNCPSIVPPGVRRNAPAVMFVVSAFALAAVAGYAAHFEWSRIRAPVSG